MKIILNGQPRECAPAIALKNIVEQFCKDQRFIIAEVNGAIVQNTQWESRILSDGDTIELVNFVGGG